ncbi:SDR family NAD(P)-dependent oxidoreductase [Geodermatophilus sp. SYSU D00758]
MRRLSGRRVVVAGGATGIGAAIARAFTAEAARVVVLDRDGPALDRLAAAIGCRTWAVDLDDVRQARESMEKAIAWLGGIDVLVNDAGPGRFAPLLEMEPAELASCFSLPARTMLTTTQTAALAMVGFRAPGDECAGKVVNVASAGRGAGGQAHYAAAKASVMALTRAAAHELGPHGITVNCLCPGYVRDPHTAADRPEAASWSALSPLGRVGEPEDVARAAVFLASSDSDYLTGDALHVAGGMVLH